MPRTQKRRKKPGEEHTYIAIRVEHHDASISAGVNSDAYAPQLAWNLDDDAPVFEFTSQVTIMGVSTYPPERAGDTYDLTISSVDTGNHRIYAKLKDIHARDERRLPQYRTHRGRQIPVYVAPYGLGTLDKVRGEKRWTGWIFVAPRFVNDLLVLLTYQPQLFLGLHEFKVERSRWLRSVTLQTTDPAEE